MLSPATSNKISKLLDAGYFEVSQVAQRFNPAEMKVAFDAVCNKQNWKCEIEGRITADKLTLTCAAIAFFTASECYLQHIADTTEFNLYAPGYYERVGA